MSHEPCPNDASAKLHAKKQTQSPAWLTTRLTAAVPLFASGSSSTQEDDGMSGSLKIIKRKLTDHALMK